MFQKSNGELIFLEAAARTPGALVPEMYEIAFNIHLEEMHYLSQINPKFIPKQQLSINPADGLPIQEYQEK